jgi:two-component system, OmpR family, response regulator CssR
MLKKKFQVLLVEDDKFMNEILREFIESEGMFIDTTLTHEEAMNKILNNNNKYDILIVDYNLDKSEEKNGIDVYEKIKTINPEIKAIMISAYGNKTIKKNAYNKGINYFIDKPFLLEELTLKLCDMMA